MALRNSRLSKWSAYIILISFIIFFTVIAFFLIIQFYPIQTISQNFNNAEYSRFLAPWPESALNIENQERRKLKRFAKTEQLRRMEIQMQRMEILHIPIYDLFLDSTTELTSFNNVSAPDDTAFLWPILPARKTISNPLNANYMRKSSIVVFPYNHWNKLMEGMLVLGGEELKATIPIGKGRRSFHFTLFLLTPGSIRISLGQYVWAKSFTDNDVQKRMKINIPINDSTATSLKIISISSNFYVLDASVKQSEHSARSPIRVAKNSLLWSADPNLLITNSQNSNKTSEDTVDTTTEESLVDEQKPDEIKQEELNQIGQEKTKPTKKPIINIPDPLSQINNPQQIVDDKMSTAFGYNVVIIQIPKFSSIILKNNFKIKKYSPNISKIMENSLIFNRNISISENPDENFRRFIFSEHEYLNSENVPIVKKEVEKKPNKNTYVEMRKYGYNVAGFAFPEAYYFNKEISVSKNFSRLYGKWLEKNDWFFAQKNLDIDDKNVPASGLDAIFKTKTKNIVPALTASDFFDISEFLTGVSKNIDKVPDWSPNEYILINNENMYIPRTVDAFQNWTKENQQTRFFAHILLDDNKKDIRPTLKNFAKSISTLGLSSIVNPTLLHEIALRSYIDQAVGQILDTIVARKIENRTIVFILEPYEKVEGKVGNYASGILKIPGLVPKKQIDLSHIEINDIVSTIMTNVGIPTGNNVENKISEINGLMLENIDNKQISELKKADLENTEKEKFYKYTLIIKPDEQNCSSFIWTPKINGIFGLTANVPIYNIIDEKIIEFFPCSLKNKFVNITWYQSIDTENQGNNIDEFIGGHFSYRKNSISLPNFYFGKSLLSSDSIPFYFENITTKNLENIFFVEENNWKKYQEMIQKNFNSIDSLEKKNKDYSDNSKKTKIGFLITPL